MKQALAEFEIAVVTGCNSEATPAHGLVPPQGGEWRLSDPTHAVVQSGIRVHVVTAPSQAILDSSRNRHRRLGSLV